MKVVLASGNQGKVKELSQLLQNRGIEVVAQSEFGLITPDETGLSFIENAILKARYAAQQTGLPAIADDSGIAIDALGGEPGIYSARYAGEDASDQQNIEKVLSKLQGVPKEQRGASFHCVLVFMRHAADPTPIVCHGKWQGEILTEMAGDGGFGYDPIFWVPEKNCSAAQLTKAEKNAISHRGQALASLLSQLSA